MKNDASVSALVGARVHPLVAPEGVVLPYVTYEAVGGGPMLLLASVSSTLNWTIQVNAWHSTYTGVKALAEALRDSLNGWRDLAAIPEIGGTFLVDERDDPIFPSAGGEEPKYRVSQDYSIWFA